MDRPQHPARLGEAVVAGGILVGRVVSRHPHLRGKITTISGTVAGRTVIGTTNTANTTERQRCEECQDKTWVFVIPTRLPRQQASERLAR